MAILIFTVTIWHALFLVFVHFDFSAFCFCLANGSFSHRFVSGRRFLLVCSGHLEARSESFLVFSFYLRSLVALLFFHFNFSMPTEDVFQAFALGGLLDLAENAARATERHEDDVATREDDVGRQAWTFRADLMVLDHLDVGAGGERLGISLA
jgi:hypothetical protein